MNLDSLSSALAQISYLVTNLSKKNYKASETDISQLVTQHGIEAEKHMLRCLLSQVDFSSESKSVGCLQTVLLVQGFESILSKPNFVSNICSAIDEPLQEQKTLKPSNQLLYQISKMLKLTKVQEVALALALQHSTNPEMRQYANQFVRYKLSDLLTAYSDGGSGMGQEQGSLTDSGVDILHFLLTHILQNEERYGLNQATYTKFFATLRREFPRDQVPVILGPLLYGEKADLPSDRLLPDKLTIPKIDVGLADMVSEAGHAFASDVAECRNRLMKFGVAEINPTSISNVLGVMARTPIILSEAITTESGQIEPPFSL